MLDVTAQNQRDRISPQNGSSPIEEVFRLYDRAMAATSTGIVIADARQPDNPIIYCNPAFEKISGYPRKEVIGRNCRFLQGSDTNKTVVKEIRAALTQERECKVILKNYRKDGTPFWNELTISPVRNPQGQLTHFIGVQTDVTDRVEAEEAVREAEIKYRSIFENATEGIFQIAPDGRYLSANPALARIYGYDFPAELMANCVAHELYVDGDRRTQLLRQLSEKGGVSNFESAVYRKDGREIWISENIREVRNERGELLYYEGTVEDVTKRKQAEADLVTQEYWLKTLIDAVPDMVILKDGQGRWVVANEAALKVYGLQGVDYGGHTPESLARVTEDCHRDNLLADRETDETTWNAKEINYTTKIVPQADGFIQIFDMSMVPLFNADGSRKGLVVVGREITDRVKAEAALLDSEKRFRTMFEGAAIGMAQTFLHGQMLMSTNPAFQEMLGYTEAELRRMSLKSLSHPDDIDVDEQFYLELVSGQRESYKSEKRYLRKDGSVMWGRLSVSVIGSVQGQTRYILAMLEDVTARKQAQMALSRNEAKWRSLIQNSSDIITILDERGIILYESPAVRGVLGYAPEEMVGQSVMEFIHTEDLPLLISKHQKLTATPATAIPLECRFRRADGSWCFLEAVGVNLLNEPAVRGIVINSRDMTARKQAEERLNKINECFLGFGTDAVENIDRLTQLAGELLGGSCAVYYRLEDNLLHLVGQWNTPPDFKPNDEARGRVCYDLIQKGSDRPVVIRNLQNSIYAQTDPYVVAYELHTYVAQAVRRGSQSLGSVCVLYKEPVEPTEADLKLLGIIAAAIKVEEERAAAAASERQKSLELEQALHELQQTQMQLIQTEKMSGLGQLVAGVAHEINNPVSFVTGNLTHAHDYIQDLLELVQLYQYEYGDPTPPIQQKAEAIDLDFVMEDLPKLLKSMKMGSDRICEIVQTLRNFSRVDEADIKSVDIHQGIKDTLLILHNRLKAKPNSPGIQVIEEYSNLPLVDCYPGQLNQVFMNILANAIDALEEYGTSIAGDSQDNPSPRTNNYRPTIQIRTELLNADHVSISITDNGPGIPPEIRSKLFDPFFTTKPVGRGTGLGLSISYQIVVDKHGGRLLCICEPGKGTEFRIELPLRHSDTKT